MREMDPNYRALFIMSMSFIAIGSSFISMEPMRPLSPAFVGIGGLFLIISLKNKDKWDLRL